MKEPTICAVLDVIGWVVICISALGALFSLAETRILWAMAAGIISGVLFLALSMVIRKLGEIEYHLRPGAKLYQ